MGRRFIWPTPDATSKTIMLADPNLDQTAWMDLLQKDDGQKPAIDW